MEPWTSGGSSVWSCRRAAEMTLRLVGPRSEELGSKGEMQGTHSKGLWGVGDAGKGRSVVATTSRETMMAMVLKSKGNEGRQGSGGVVEASL
jgi:hypothetical protein